MSSWAAVARGVAALVPGTAAAAVGAVIGGMNAAAAVGAVVGTAIGEEGTVVGNCTSGRYREINRSAFLLLVLLLILLLSVLRQSKLWRSRS